MLIISPNGVDRDADVELRRLQALCSDLAKIAGGYQPVAELADAPFLDNYAGTFRMAPCLTGIIHGHPTVRGPAVLTSDLWVYAPELGWARTLNRFYRLGRPMAERDGVRRH